MNRIYILIYMYMQAWVQTLVTKCISNFATLYQVFRHLRVPQTCILVKYGVVVVV